MATLSGLSPLPWARRCFDHAVLGDSRRTQRLVEMARGAAVAPAGRITDVFRCPAQRQAAYDFLEHDEVPVEGVQDALFKASVRASDERTYVAVDGTSLALADHALTKGFGHIGAIAQGAQGLKVINALALDVSGTPIGLVDQQWWSRHGRADRRRYRAADSRESAFWRNAVAQVVARYAAASPTTKLHFLMDREGDASLLIHHMLESGHEFTIRTNAKRKVQGRSGRCDVRRVLLQKPVLGHFTIDLPATAQRDARTARLWIRSARLPIVLRDHHIHQRRVVWLTVVWARETSLRPDRLDWLVWTNSSVELARDAIGVVRRYAWRWRVEDFHRTWKSGLCRVEETQLRSVSAVIKWSTILAAVANRAELLRHQYRHSPDAPAEDTFNADEIEAIVFLKNEGRKKTPLTSKGLTIATAVRWVADLGGYVGNRGSGPPGAITISRGLERVVFAAELLARLRSEGRLR